MLPRVGAGARHSASWLCHRAATRHQSLLKRADCPLLFSSKARTVGGGAKGQLDSAFFSRRIGNISTGQRRKNDSRRHYYAIGIGAAVVLSIAGPRFDDLKSEFLNRVWQTTLTSHFVSGAPVIAQAKELSDIKQTVYPVLDLDAANAKLKASEQSYISDANGAAGESSVSRFDILRLPSNSPCEDDFAFATVDVGQERDWQFWGVYDGHAGWATSALLRNSLIAYVGREIKDLLKMQGGTATPEAIDAAITSAFLRLDGEIIDDGLKAMTDSQTPGEAVSRTAPARAGSCALLAVHDPVNSLLRVACVGDSRAVLGRRPSPAGDGKSWTTIELSSDQTGFNPDECARLAENHPGESKIIDPRSGRLLGIAVTRAFGDHRWKWPSAAIERWASDYFGSGLRPHYKTPPYMTAEPVITTTTVQKGDFVILASDGFWDRVTNEDAVKCVSKWINRESSSKKDAQSEWSIHKSKGVGFPQGKVSPDTFVVEDENVATHLVRNALGGNRREHFCGELSLQSPESRYERDDITVQVIFFGDVERNQRARI